MIEDDVQYSIDQEHLDWMDILERAGWQFVLTFLAFIGPALKTAEALDAGAVWGIVMNGLISALSGALSMAKTSYLQRRRRKRAHAK